MLYGLETDEKTGGRGGRVVMILVRSDKNGRHKIRIEYIRGTAQVE